MAYISFVHVHLYMGPFPIPPEWTHKILFWIKAWLLFLGGHSPPFKIFLGWKLVYRTVGTFITYMVHWMSLWFVPIAVILLVPLRLSAGYHQIESSWQGLDRIRSCHPPQGRCSTNGQWWLVLRKFLKVIVYNVGIKNRWWVQPYKNAVCANIII